MTNSKLPGVRELLSQSWRQLLANWKILLLVVAVVALPSNLLTALGEGTNLGAYASLAALFMNLALVWTVGNLGKKSLGLKEAYYRGTRTLLPFMFVLLVLALQSLALVLGTALLGLGAAGATLGERLLIGLLAAILSLPSIYWLNRYLWAIFIVPLDEKRPVASLRHSRELVSGRGWLVLGRLMALSALMLVGLLLPSLALLPLYQSTQNPVWLILLQLLGTLLLLPFSTLYLHNVYLALKKK